MCKYIVTKEHLYKDGKCSECSAIEPTGGSSCTHSYIIKQNETQHWEECSCGQIKDDSLEKHTYENYKDNNDGTHTATCTKCRYELTEKHSKEECEDCNVTENKDDNAGNNNDDDKKDDTIIDAIIPNAGASSFIILGIIALGTISGAIVLKLKKYKGV